MNSAYVYLQLYRLFDTNTPLPVDCGKLCDCACCKGEGSGMFLFPGEKEVFKLLNPNGFEIEPQLIAAQYNYYFHIGRFADAEKTLDYLDVKFADSFIFQPQGKPVPVRAFISNQRRVLEIVKRRVSE